MHGEAKDYSGWFDLKPKLNQSSKLLHYAEGDIWWASIGANIGHEEDGKGIKFSRPVVIARGFSEHIIWIVPLSTTNKRGEYYMPFKFSKSQVSVGLLSQLRAIDALRLTTRIGHLSQNDFINLKASLRKFLF